MQLIIMFRHRPPLNEHLDILGGFVRDLLMEDIKGGQGRYIMTGHEDGKACADPLLGRALSKTMQTESSCRPDLISQPKVSGEQMGQANSSSGGLAILLLLPMVRLFLFFFRWSGYSNSFFEGMDILILLPMIWLFYFFSRGSGYSTSSSESPAILVLLPRVWLF